MGERARRFGPCPDEIIFIGDIATKALALTRATQVPPDVPPGRGAANISSVEIWTKRCART